MFGKIERDSANLPATSLPLRTQETMCRRCARGVRAVLGALWSALFKELSKRNRPRYSTGNFRDALNHASNRLCDFFHQNPYNSLKSEKAKASPEHGPDSAGTAPAQLK